MGNSLAVRFGFLVRVSALAFCAVPATAGTFEADIKPVLRSNCVGCHSGASPAGRLDLARFGSEAAVRSDLRTWSKILDLVGAHQMPPAPTKMKPEDRSRLTAWIEEFIENPGSPPDPGRPVLRRLTRLEYNNTVRDLLRLDRDLFMMPERLPYTKGYFDPSLERMPRALEVEMVEYGQHMPVLLKSSGLPGENRAEHGFTNRGDSLNISPLLMEKYLTVAADVAQSPELLTRSSVARVLAAPSSTAQLRQKLDSLLTRAYRRPPDPTEVLAHERLYREVLGKTGSGEQASRAVIRLALSSPAFLMRTESGRHSADGSLDGFALASRLSYFLWASMPDDELLDLAREGSLQDPVILAQQAARMLRDRKARELSDTFAFQWLQLNEMFGAQPDVGKFNHYYVYDVFGTNKGNLAQDMIAEALLLFETVMIENQSIQNFVDARYTYLNTRLMKHYRLEAQYAKEFKDATVQYGNRKGPQRFFRVQLPDRTRGGVLGLGAVLTMTSTPVRTSPVFRGAWMLEALFNRPPAPPPNAVPTIEEQGGDESGLSVRQKLEAHRKNPACASCHSRMDPLGFALENYDPVGVWRTKDGSADVDPSGALSGGGAFSGPEQFKDVLLARRQELARGFSEHLLSYALNRKLEYFDRPAVRKILHQAASEEYRFHRIVQEIVNSVPFRFVRTERQEVRL